MTSDDSNSNDKKTGGMTDLAKKVFLTGVGAIFMGEEKVRKTFSDLNLSTDAVSGLMESVKKQKDEVLQVVAVELSNFLSHVNLHEELQKALIGMQIHLDAKISFDKNQPIKEGEITVQKKPRE